MNNYLHFQYWFLVNTGKKLGFTLVGLMGFLVTTWAADPGTLAAPADLTLTVSSAATTATVCSGTSVTLTASGCPTTGALRWSTTQTGNVIAVTPKQTTTYTAICEVTSTSAVSSTATSSTTTSSTATSSTGIVTTITTTTAAATVQVYSPILVTPDTQSPLCNAGNDGVIYMNSTGGVGALQYQIGNEPFKALNVFGNLKAGTYLMTVKDTKGCTVQTNVELKQPPEIIVSTTVIGTKCVGGGDGALIASAIGGVGDFRYSILNLASPQTSGTFINLVANTTYTVMVSDKNNCVVFQSVNIGQPAPFAIKLTPVPTRCVGTSDGSVSVSATGGTGTYQYQLGTGPFQTGAQFTGLAANTYEITVKDGLGCTGKQTTTVGQPAALTLTATSKPVGCLSPTSGAIIMTPTGGTGAVTYQITAGATPQSSSLLSGLGVGNYTVIGMDANGCTSLASVTIGKVDPLKAQATAIPATCCSCPTGAVSLTTTGGTGTGLQFQVIGQAAQTTNQITKLTPNTYRLRVLDDGGCADSTVAIVTDKNALTLSVGTIKNVSCAGGKDGQATVQVAGGAKPFTYFWQTERKDTLKPFVASQSALSEGTYTVSVRDSNRCTTSTVFVSLTATNPTPPKPTVSQVANSTLTVNQTTGVQWYVSTGTSSATAVPNATGATLVPFASGQYYAVVTVNGCPSPPSDAINFILTALSEPIALLSARVVPNPIVDRLRVEIEQPERSAVQLYLLDASGRVVRTYQLPAFIGKKQAEWPIEGISTGTYLLKLTAESRQSVLRVAVE
ncbi:T9SS type A sorting domain-containing protein [Spirosoma migulaei]